MPHAALVGNATFTTYLSSVTYQCNVGYSANVTDNKIISWCQDSGNWLPVSTCQGKWVIIRSDMRCNFTVGT